jgi:two-component system, OmpR family, KDP operon response regulator KdpE
MSLGRILIVDDEPKLVRLVSEILLATGYQPLAASSGEQAIEMVALEQPNLAIMDIQLLGEIDGYQATRRIREFSDIPIIMLTINARESDLLRGFEAGADDYLTNPFSSKELMARLRALLARSQMGNGSRLEPDLTCGDLHIDIRRRVVAIHDQEVHLTPTEYKLLHELARHCNQVMLHEQILSAVWGPEYINDVDYLRSYIHCLRKKLEPEPANPRLIISNPGVGYMLAMPESELE